MIVTHGPSHRRYKHRRGTFLICESHSKFFAMVFPILPLLLLYESWTITLASSDRHLANIPINVKLWPPTSLHSSLALERLSQQSELGRSQSCCSRMSCILNVDARAQLLDGRGWWESACNRNGEVCAEPRVPAHRHCACLFSGFLHASNFDLPLFLGFELR